MRRSSVISLLVVPQVKLGRKTHLQEATKTFLTTHPPCRKDFYVHIHLVFQILFAEDQSVTRSKYNLNICTARRGARARAGGHVTRAVAEDKRAVYMCLHVTCQCMSCMRA
jgi:hypothetical protein